jgi:uncharacterized membrane protein
MTPLQKTKLRWWIIWLLSVTAGPMLAVSFDNSLHWMGLLIGCFVANLIASFCLMTTGNRVNKSSSDASEIAAGCLLFLGGAVVLAAFCFMGCVAWQF